MALVLTNGRISVGAYKFPNTKKIAICVKEGNKITVCGYFDKDENAEYFMNKLGECVGVEHEDNCSEGERRENGDKH